MTGTSISETVVPQQELVEIQRKLLPLYFQYRSFISQTEGDAAPHQKWQ